MSEPILLQHYIGGEALRGNPARQSIDPADAATVLAIAPQADAATVARAVDAAASALVSQRALTGAARAESLRAWGAAIKANADEMALDLAREVGKPITEAKGEVGRCVAVLDYFAGEAVREIGQVIPALRPSSLQFTLREPVGVCALICPWNFPLAIPLWKAAPALAFGNAVILKPAEQAPLAADWLARTAIQAGLGAEFSVVHGDGDTGAHLAGSDGVDAVSFTGSVDVGRVIARVCAEDNRKFQGEMGGKNAAIVLADADMALAAKLVAAGAMSFAGQKCTATSRAIVVQSALDEFMSALEKAVRAMPIGAPTDAGTAIGPVIDEVAQNRIRETINGQNYTKEIEIAAPNGGCYVSPTVFADVESGSDLAQEEIFGPVLAVVGAEDFDVAIQFANETRYGLSAAIFTRDIDAAMRFVEAIDVGLVRVNGDTTGVDPHAPFGGMRASSSHSREQGPAAKEFYTETKTVQINP